MVYINNPHIIEELKHEILAVISINEHTLPAAVQNFKK
jgi:septum formation topological specificity factor MinE